MTASMAMAAAMAAMAAGAMEGVAAVVEARYVYLFVVLLAGVGLYGVLTQRNMIMKVIGLTIFKTAVFIFFIAGSVRQDGTVPIIDEEIGPVAEAYMNPLPHLMILTALIVSVAVLTVALALAVTVHRAYGTLDEEELARRMGGS